MNQPIAHTSYEQIERMRTGGMTFAAIAETLGMSPNTAKSIWRRYGPKPEVAVKCKHCGAELPNAPKGRLKRFCSAKCRSRWRYAHRGDSPALPRRTCLGCGQTFTARGGQKFCSRACYLKHTGGILREQGSL